MVLLLRNIDIAHASAVRNRGALFTNTLSLGSGVSFTSNATFEAQTFNWGIADVTFGTNLITGQMPREVNFRLGVPGQVNVDYCTDMSCRISISNLTAGPIVFPLPYRGEINFSGKPFSLSGSPQDLARLTFEHSGTTATLAYVRSRQSEHCSPLA